MENEIIIATKVTSQLLNEPIPVTIETAKWAENFEHRTEKNKDKTPLRLRRNGKTKLWKTRPNEFQIPAKHGLYDYYYITHNNADEWYVVN